MSSGLANLMSGLLLCAQLKLLKKQALFVCSMLPSVFTDPGLETMLFSHLNGSVLHQAYLRVSRMGLKSLQSWEVPCPRCGHT